MSGATAQRVYRALSSPVRTRLVEVLRDEPDLDTAALAQRLGLHANTVRTHLQVLEEAGLVEPTPEERDRPGRPRLLYRVVPDEQQPPAAGGDDRGYRFLASVLAGYLGAATEDPPAAAEQAGRAWGGFVVDRPPPFTRVEPRDAVGRLLAMLDEFGFAPALDQGDAGHPKVLLRRCPFLEVAREHQDVVCSVHLGLMRGAAEELDAGVEVEDLIPWATSEGCVAHLEVASERT